LPLVLATVLAGLTTASAAWAQRSGPPGTDASAAGAPPLPAALRRHLDVLDHFIGTWRVSLRTIAPQPTIVTYTESYAWTLGRRFVRAEVDNRSDGISTLAIGSFDTASGGYPFWIFMSNGAWFYLEPGQWDARERSMTWTASAASPVAHRSRCVFPEPDLRLCHTLVKDWKGSVLLEQESRAERQAR
jgi:hypothetical protein